MHHRLAQGLLNPSKRFNHTEHARLRIARQIGFQLVDRLLGESRDAVEQPTLYQRTPLLNLVRRNLAVAITDLFNFGQTRSEPHFKVQGLRLGKNPKSYRLY